MSHPQPRGMYAFNEGRAGDFILFVSESRTHYSFIEFPGNTVLHLTKEDFIKSIDTNVIEFAEALPLSVFEETVSYVKRHEKGLD